mmetsp:Transcript_92674/g.265639  ORF Transcript_92674/g.265639 Transcript_92674/m.265639 type:complete len:222 (-) Transcript_92674:1157-1822(-)
MPTASPSPSMMRRNINSLRWLLLARSSKNRKAADFVSTRFTTPCVSPDISSDTWPLLSLFLCSSASQDSDSGIIISASLSSNTMATKTATVVAMAVATRQRATSLIMPRIIHSPNLHKQSVKAIANVAWTVLCKCSIRERCADKPVRFACIDTAVDMAIKNKKPTDHDSKMSLSCNDGRSKGSPGIGNKRWTIVKRAICRNKKLKIKPMPSSSASETSSAH